MFDKNTRSQVGIGTLIIFIAMILVAAIAAGALINTTGLLQTQAESTGKDTQQQASNRIQIQSVTGNVNRGYGDAEIDRINVTVTKFSGAGRINLKNVSYEFNTYTTIKTGRVGSDEVAVDAVTRATQDNIITSESDRYTIIFSLNESTNRGESNLLDSGLHSGDSATLTLTTASGASTLYRLRVPDSLFDRSAVLL